MCCLELSNYPLDHIRLKTFLQMYITNENPYFLSIIYSSSLRTSCVNPIDENNRQIDVRSFKNMGNISLFSDCLEYTLRQGKIEQLA